MVVVATTVAASAGVLAAVDDVDDASLGLLVSAATLAPGVVSPAAGVDGSAAGVVSLVVAEGVVTLAAEEDEDALDVSLAAVLAPVEPSPPVVDADGVPAASRAFEAVPDAELAAEADESGAVTPCWVRFWPGPRTVFRSCNVFRMLLVGRPPERRGPAATVVLLEVLPLVPLSAVPVALPAPVDSPAAPEVPEPVESGVAAAIPPLPAKRTPLAITHAPNTALT